MTKYKESLAFIGGLSAPAKMPCNGWSIPAETCKVGSKMRGITGSTCSSCYALKGQYQFPNVQEAMYRRYRRLAAALLDGSIGKEFAHHFAEVLNHKWRTTMSRIQKGTKVGKDGRYFRWHDSGDLQSVDHLALIVLVAKWSPEVQHWLPTRESRIVEKYLESNTLPGNLTVRISTSRVDRAPSGLDFKVTLEDPQVASSGVHTSEPVGALAQSCIAYQQEGECRDCRACWDADQTLISYPLH